MQEVSTYNVEKVFVYDVFGQMAAEYSLGAQSLPCTTCYIATDHLGSTRLVTDQNANVVGRHDYLPFGEEIAANTGGRNGMFRTQDFVNQKFTSQERDTETGLDFFQAPYFSGALGRFASPDPDNAGANLFSPQSWNAYTYVRNNPLVLIDPTGMWENRVTEHSFPNYFSTNRHDPLDRVTLIRHANVEENREMERHRTK